MRLVDLSVSTFKEWRRKSMDLLEGNLSDPINHWYYSHKFRMIVKSVEKDLPNIETLVDIGAGSAIFSLAIQKMFPKIEITAVDTGYELDEKIDSVDKIAYLKSGKNVVGQVYLFTDVLEHVPDDILMLREYVKNAPNGSKFVITVPAFMTLWSGHDDFLKHFRRYTKQEIENVVSKSGLSLVKSNYMFCSLFPIAFLLRRLPSSRKKVSQLRNHSKLMNSMILFSLRLDRVLTKFIPFGISIIVLAEKDAN
jgi:hypothetical protein